MQKSEEIGKLTTAMVAALSEMSHPVKNKVNPHFKNRYADLLAVVDCSREALLKHGLCVLQVPEGLGVANMIIHESGEYLYFQATMPDAPQKFGSGLTYLRRYGMQGLTQLVAEEDDDAEATRVTEKDDW